MVVAKKATNCEAAKLAEVVFDEFIQASDSVDILLAFHKLKAAVGAEKLENGKDVYAVLKSKLTSWKCKSLWDVLDARAKHKEYGNGKICEDLLVLVIGCGPIGLRTAIEVALLGAKVIIVEKRAKFSRNNVLHLWPFLINDFRSLGAKKFYGKFCSGSLDHIGIKVLQCLLMKAALILGVQIYTGVTFEKVLEPTSDCGWRCQVNPPFHPASQFDLDMVVGADGKKNVLPDFPQIEMRGSLAIGITLNLVYHGTKQEAAIQEVSGLAYHFKPQFFDELYQRSGVRLENFVYYKGETHYFVMTAVKSSLIARGALLMDYPKPADLLAPQNVNYERLKEYALDAVKFGTNEKLTDIEFVTNDRGKSDIAVFDFTSLKKAEHAARIVERKGHRLLLALVGDSLIEPFWPTGSGCARGVLSALDTAWMLRSFAMDRPPLQVLSERENIYKLLSATSVGNLRKNYDAYTINPFTRYVDLNLKRVKEVYHLYDSDDPVNADFRVGNPTSVGSLLENTKRRLSVKSGGHTVKPGKNRRKSSSDDLDEKKGRNRTRKSSSDDLDEKKGSKSRKKSIKEALRRSHSRDTDSELNNSKTKNKNKLKKLRSQSSESADEKEVRGRKKKLGRTKSRDTDGSNNSLNTIEESPKTVAKNERNAENKDNSDLMKQRSTKRWKLFGGTKPKVHSMHSIEKETNEEGKANAKKGENLKNLKIDLDSEAVALKSKTKQKEGKKEVPEGQAKNVVEHPKNGLARSVSKDASSDRKGQTGAITESLSRSTQRQLNQESSSPKPLRHSLKKPSEVRAAQNAGFARSISSSAATMPRANEGVKRTNSDIMQTDPVFRSLRRAREEKQQENKTAQIDVAKKGRVASEKTGTEKADTKRPKLDKRVRSVSVFDDIRSLSPAAQRTAPLLKTLTPEKEGGYQEGGAVTAAAGLAAMLALTTSLAMEAEQSLKEFQIERQKIMTNNTVSVRDKIAFLNSASNRKIRRDLTSALDSVDGSPKPIKRFSSFSTAQRNVKQKLEDETHKSLTLPRNKVTRQSLQDKMFLSHADLPSALDSAIDILIKSYSFAELQGTLKIMLNIFRSISKDPDDEIPRRISTKGELFRTLVWDLKEAKLFMIISGWMDVGNFILFPKTKTVHEPIRVLMQNYRQLWEKQGIETSCPQFVSPESSVKRRRRPSEEILREHPEREDGKDTGSHSGSDSGMGFSETASEHNMPAVMSLKPDDVTADVFTDDIRRQVPDAQPKKLTRMEENGTQALDPRLYLEASIKEDPNQSMNPSQYLYQSNVIPEQPSTISDSPMDYPSVPIDHPSKNLKKHYWEILEEPAATPQSPQGVLYSPSHQLQSTQDKRSSFRDSRQVASDQSMEEVVDPILLPNELVIKKHSSNEDVHFSDSEVFTKEEGLSSPTKQKTKEKDELDDLFATLDFVSEALAPPRVVYEEKPKKNRRTAKSNEASRRREQYTRSKLQQSSTEEQTKTPRTKRRNRGQAATEKAAVDNDVQPNSRRGRRQISEKAFVDDGIQQATKRQIPRGSSVINDNKVGNRKTRKQQQDTESSEMTLGNTARSRQRRNPADQSTNEPVRRSQRVADRNAVLVLDTRGYPEESSTDLNQAFVNSQDSALTYDESLQNGNVDYEKTRKKKVRRQSSIVKTNKSRARTKRNGYKSRKDRSIDT